MATLRLVPSTYYLSNSSYLSISNASNMYTNTDSTTYATVTNSRASTTAYYVYIRGFNFSDIPDDVTINSFTIKVKVKESGGKTTSGSSYVGLYNNTTSVNGTPSGGMATTEKTITFTSTPDLDTIKGYGSNFGIRLAATRNSRNTTAYLYIYGAEILIDYTEAKTKYNVTSSLTLSGGATGTIDPSGTTQVSEGDSYILEIYPGEDGDVVTIKDNNVDKTSSLVEKDVPSGGTFSSNITSYEASGSLSTATAFSNANGKGSDATTTTSNGYCSTSGSTVTVTYGFTFDDIPSNATITGVTCKVSGHAESSSNSNEHCDIQLYKGNTAVGSQKSFKSTGTTNTVLELNDSGSWTRSELDNLTLKVIVGYYGGAINGATTAVTYETPGGASKMYTYTLSNVAAAHTLAVVIALGSSDELYFKDNGSWVKVEKAYRKVSGAWVEVTDLTTLFDTTKNYIKGN